MSLNKKLIFLVFIFVILTIYTVTSFDYTKVSTYKISEIKQINDVIKIKNNDKAIYFEITKNNKIVLINGEFKNTKEFKYIIDYLNINKEENITFNNKIVYEQKNINEIKELISPLKDYFNDGSKITLKDKEISIQGKLKDKKFYNLILSILDKSQVAIKRDITIEKIVVPVIPKESLQSKIDKLLLETKVSFKRKSSVPTKNTFVLLNKLAQLIKEENNIQIEIQGHTDARGASSLNKRISLYRAEIIKRELIKLGIKETLLKAVGYGEEQLVKDGAEHYSKLNRRVEFKVIELNVQEVIALNLQDSINDILKNNKIEFKRRSSEVTKASLKALEEIALLIISNNLEIEIAGHTDARGAASLNKRISKQRADGVKTELILLGVNKDLLSAVGYGESKPIAKNDKNGLSKINRRVEFYVMEKK